MFHILVVCSANICRSPYAAELLRAGGVRHGADLSVTTAGTEASTGDAMCESAHGRLGEMEHVQHSRPLRRDLLTTADLVLTAERRHRAAAVTLLPSAHAKIFTLLEAASLAALVRSDEVQLSPTTWVRSMDSARGRALLGGASRGRAWLARNGSDALDIPDGHGAGARAHGRALDSVGSATDRLLDSIPWDNLRSSTVEL